MNIAMWLLAGGLLGWIGFSFLGYNGDRGVKISIVIGIAGAILRVTDNRCFLGLYFWLLQRALDQTFDRVDRGRCVPSDYSTTSKFRLRADQRIKSGTLA